MGRNVGSYKMTGLGWRQRAKKLFHCCHFDPYYSHGTCADKWFTFFDMHIYERKSKPWWMLNWGCRRVSFIDCVHALGHSPGRASTCSYQIKVTIWQSIWLIFSVLGYIGEDSAISDALGPRSKIMLISDRRSLEAASRKSKGLDTLLSHIGT